MKICFIKRLPALAACLTLLAFAAPALAADGIFTGDQGITANVEAALVEEYGLNAENINVHTSNGVVILTGSVDYQDQAEVARDAAARVPGVIRVDNRLVPDDK